MFTTRRHAAAALAVALLLPAFPALSDAVDYRFEVVGHPVRSGEATLIRLRLLRVADGKPVAGAILIQPKLEMGAGPGGMAAPVKPAAAAEPGLYAVEARPNMDGEWTLILAAKVPGEAATVRGAVVLNLVQ